MGRPPAQDQESPFSRSRFATAVHLSLLPTPGIHSLQAPDEAAGAGTGALSIYLLTLFRPLPARYEMCLGTKQSGRKDPDGEGPIASPCPRRRRSRRTTTSKSPRIVLPSCSCPVPKAHVKPTNACRPTHRLGLNPRPSHRSQKKNPPWSCLIPAAPLMRESSAMTWGADDVRGPPHDLKQARDASLPRPQLLAASNLQPGRGEAAVMAARYIAPWPARPLRCPLSSPHSRHHPSFFSFFSL